MTKVYVAMIDERHTDTEAEVFGTAEAAIAYAKQQAQPGLAITDDYEEQDIEGWLFYASYSVEGDCVWVVEKELH